MKYVELGKTGLMCAQISFGGIPVQRSSAENAKAVVDQLERYGMNFMDTARGYTVSEEYLGMALEGRREKFILATKGKCWDYEGMKKDIQTSLDNFRTDHIDLYQMHNPTSEGLDKIFAPGGAYEAMAEAKEQGKIGHIGATAHSLEVLERMVNEFGDRLETVMFPYNIVETHGHEVLKAAREKGIGTIAMKPLAGGNLEDWNLALRFIADSGVIDISIPGMGAPEEVDRNAAAAEVLTPLTAEELEQCETIRRELGNQFCRRCGYCAPCTVGIDIPSSLLFENYAKRYKLIDWANDRYRAMGHYAGDCVECGVCEERCPYQLPIREMLKSVKDYFGY